MIGINAIEDGTPPFLFQYAGKERGTMVKMDQLYQIVAFFQIFSSRQGPGQMSGNHAHKTWREWGRENLLCLFVPFFFCL